mmetsp:Transcript_15204/g.35226  ORF Transcript_15204/g.35226 Transcript_15204/m.35226 type:complete len:1259 (-) Transcript_15204:365-4141(-)
MTSLNTYSGGGQRRPSGRRSGRQPTNINILPFEQGIICSLKESFGFIHCAERPEDLFFHYSEVQNFHPDDLQIDTEVEFKVGRSGSDNKKLAAFSVICLEPGTVVWEIEDREEYLYQGLVEKPCLSPRGDRDGRRGVNSGPQTDGFVRIIEPQDSNNLLSINQNDDESNITDHKKEGKVNSKKEENGALVRFRAGEHLRSKQHDIENSSNWDNINSPPRLFRGDLIEFRVFLDRRTKQRYARYITLIQSDRERKRIEKEKRLLEDASAEEGIIVSLNKGFGFIKSNRRREDVYFHYSHLILPEITDDGKDDEDFELKKGQDVKFLVVSEGQTNQSSKKSGNGNSKVSARQIHCLPKGSVVFRTIEMEGVKGLCTRVPQPPSPGSKNDDSKWGRVRLIEQNNDQKGNQNEPNSSTVVKIKQDILLHFSDSPGGVFTYQNHRNQPTSALWIHEGDTLLFDIAKETVDGSYRAIPTLHKIGLGGSVISPNTTLCNGDHDNENNDTDRRAVRLANVSRIGRAEGVVHTLKPDYGFIHFAERSVDVHFKTYDLMPNQLQTDVRRSMGIDELCPLEEAAAVQFDICAHGNITTTTQRGRRRGVQQARENIRGQRLVILPKAAVSLEKCVAAGVKGVIKSTNPQQPYAGTLELEEDAQPMTMEERHPIVAKMITSFLEESSRPNGRKSIVFRDTLGMSDDNVIMEMARMKGQGVLECSHIPVPGIAPHPGKICIRRIEKVVKNDNGGVNVTRDGEVLKIESDVVPKGKRKGKDSNRAVNIVRFDKSSFEEALKHDIPPSPGDVIACDVIQSRRSGNISVRNLKILARIYEDETQMEPTPTESMRLGVVKDIVARRDFGFISVFDENNSKNELLFFHVLKDNNLKKGSEVKFDIAVEGSKRIAIKVESVRKGTIPSMASKNACLGYILMEPSHTTLSNTPSRKFLKSGSDSICNGRWAESNDDPKTSSMQEMVEDGCILLLEDKTGMFQKKYRRKKKKRSDSIDSADTSGDLSIDETKSVESDDGLSNEDGFASDDLCRDENPTAPLLSHISYKNGSIAIHGSGVTSSMDGSTNPRRGDLVSFIKGKRTKTARDIRIVERAKAFLQRGRLENIEVIRTEDKKNKGKARFIASTDDQDAYDIDLAEVVSCAAVNLKERESIEGILHQGKVYGLCRTSDLYLTSKVLGGSGKNRERPKLNLNVKRNRGGTIMAQSMMARGPDGTIGFIAGWTKRVSLYATNNDAEECTAEHENIENIQIDSGDTDQPE